MVNPTILVFLLIHIVAGDKYFPKDFSFGASTSAFQSEGGWNEDGKGLNIWDYYLHYQNSTYSVGNATPDVAADTYHHGTDDIQYLTSMGLTHYRFSISWSRILPNGTIDNVNQKGIDYYNKLLDGLISANITPVVTMHHFDTPHELEEKGGFLSNELPKWFEDYARILFENFGDRVKYWMTFNEPTVLCQFLYESLIFHPELVLKIVGKGIYKCGHTLLLAHARAYRLYEKEFKDEQKGLISIATNLDYWAPANETSEADKEAASTKLVFTFDWWMDPLTKGDYPELMRTIVDQNSKNEGLSESRLPVFTDEEKILLNGTVDYFTLNAYSGYLCSPANGYWPSPSFKADTNARCFIPKSWGSGSGQWRDTPWTLRGALLYIRDNYNNPPVLIAENGIPDDGELKDDDRVVFYRGYLTTLLDAILDEGCNVFGYTAWGFIDMFETEAGYSRTFGLIHVDFNDSSRPRTRKYSSYVYENIVRTRKVDYSYLPEFPPNKSIAIQINKTMLFSVVVYILNCLYFNI